MAMESPLSPVLNLFTDYYEQKWFQSFEKCEVILYHGYMDDIIYLFNSESDTDKFFVLLNQQHSPNIKFTIEKETHKQLSFLDLFTSNNGDNFLTCVYCKKHSVSLSSNYLISFMPFSYKIGLVKTLLYWTFIITSKWSIFHLELGKSKELLEKNFYPSNFIDQQIKQYLHVQFSVLYWKFVDRN